MGIDAMKTMFFLGLLLGTGICAEEYLFDFGNAPRDEIRSVCGGARCISEVPMACRNGFLIGGCGPAPKIELPEGFGKSGELTLNCWIRLDPALGEQGNYGILMKGSRNGFPQIQFQLSIRRLRPEFKYVSETGQWSGIMMNASDWVGIRKRIPLERLPTIPLDQWIMLSATFSHGRITLYLNGKVFLETAGNRLMPLNGHPVILGESQSGAGVPCWNFPGLIARPRFSDRACTSAEIQALERHERKLLPTGISSYLRVPQTSFSRKLDLVKQYEDSLPSPLPGLPNCRTAIRKIAGIPRITINGDAVSGMAMLPSPYVSVKNAFDSTRDFAAAGIRFYSNIIWTRGSRNRWWLGEGRYDFRILDGIVKAMIDGAPEGYVFPRVKLDPPEWWSAANPDEMAAPGQVSPSSVKWRALYRRMLRDVVTHMENAPYAGRIMGYQFGAMVGSEWIAYRIESPVAERSFRAFLRNRYHNDATELGKHYRGRNLSFETVTLRTPGRRHDPFDPIPHPDASAAARNLNAFRAETVADVILDAAAVIKNATGGRKLTGIFYGYGIPEHAALKRILNSSLIDFICSPTTYGGRRAGEPGRFSSNLQGSFRLHNKVYYDEADIRTHYYRQFVDYRCRNMKETLNVIKRTIGYSLTQGGEAWWFLLVGNETFHDNAIMETIARGADLSRRFLDVSGKPEAQLAVFRKAGQYHGNSSFRTGVLERMELWILPRSGIAYDTYDLSDIENPDLPSYQVYLFLDAYDLTEGERQAIERTVRKRGKTAVWIYAPGYYSNGKILPGGVSSLTGIRLREIKNESPVPAWSVSQNRNIAFCKLSRFFEIADPDAEVFGSFQGKPAMAFKNMGSWSSVYLLTWPDAKLLREICRRAGIHVWSDTEDTISAGRGFLMIHASTAGRKKIFLPGNGRVSEIFGKSRPEAGAGFFTDSFEFGETKIYHLDLSDKNMHKTMKSK